MWGRVFNPAAARRAALFAGGARLSDSSKPAGASRRDRVKDPVPHKQFRHRQTMLGSHRGKRLLRRRDCLLNILLRVRGSQKCRFVLRRWQVDAAVEHVTEELPERFRV